MSKQHPTPWTKRWIPETVHLLQRPLKLLQPGSYSYSDQFSDAVSVLVDDIMCGAAAVVTVQRGGTVQADGQVAGLTEEPQLLTGVEGTEDGAAETATGLQLLQTLNGVRRCSLLPPDGETGMFIHL